MQLHAGLNAAQREAILFPPHGSLQVLAGPGSGKTQVITERIAYLVNHYGLDPASICAVTYTRTAASEMTERLIPLLGRNARKVQLGTFHSVALSLLQARDRSANAYSLEVVGVEQSRSIIQGYLLKYLNYGITMNDIPNVKSVASIISNAKMNGLTLADMTSRRQSFDFSTRWNITLEVWQTYQKRLDSSKTMDFDDILVHAAALCSQKPETTNWCQYLLVDEFQDTNALQIQLTRQLAQHSCLTVVGDPDQSIYEWRFADPQNFALMRTEYFPETKIICLEENFRSSGAILSASMAIISQDSRRDKKTMFTKNAQGLAPVICCKTTAKDEARGIALEIKRVKVAMEDTLNWSDFAVLVRIKGQSWRLERALRLAEVPYKTPTTPYFDLEEIRDLAAFFELLDDPQNERAFKIVMRRSNPEIEEEGLTDILSLAQEHHVCPLEICQRIYDGELPNTDIPVRHHLRAPLEVMSKLYIMATKGATPVQMLSQLLDQIEYREYLVTKHGRKASKTWSQVLALLAFAKDLHAQDEVREVPSKIPLLRTFVHAVRPNLSPLQEENAVLISTVHSAKGLEWPVVFLSGVEEGAYPLSPENIAEDRRVLYVGCTRAKALLYMCYTTEPLSNGVRWGRTPPEMSRFISRIVNSRKEHLLSSELPEFSPRTKRELMLILGRPVPEAWQLVDDSTPDTEMGLLRPSPPAPTLLSAPAPRLISAPFTKTVVQSLHSLSTEVSSRVAQNSRITTPVPGSRVLRPMPSFTSAQTSRVLPHLTAMLRVAKK